MDGELPNSKFARPVDICCDKDLTYVVDQNNNALRVIKCVQPEQKKSSSEEACVQRELMEQQEQSNKDLLRIYCQDCQTEVNLGNDRTCAICGSKRIKILNNANQRVSKLLRPTVIY